MNDLLLFAKKLHAAADVLQGMPTELVEAAAEVVKRSVDRQIGNDLPRRRVAGGRVGVSWRLLHTGEFPSTLVRADGPLHLVNNPTKPHLILPRTSRSGKTRRARLANYAGHVGVGVHPLVLSNLPSGDGGPVFAYAVHHPGVPRGTRTWQHGVDEARPLITAAVQTRGTTILRGLLG